MKWVLHEVSTAWSEYSMKWVLHEVSTAWNEYSMKWVLHEVSTAWTHHERVTFVLNITISATPYLWRTFLQKTPSFVSCRVPSLPLILQNLTLTVAVRECSNMQTNGPSRRRQFNSDNSESLYDVWQWRPVTKTTRIRVNSIKTMSWQCGLNFQYCKIYRCTVYQDMWCDIWYLTLDVCGVLVVCCSDIIPLTYLVW